MHVMPPGIFGPASGGGWLRLGGGGAGRRGGGGGRGRGGGGWGRGGGAGAVGRSEGEGVGGAGGEAGDLGGRGGAAQAGGQATGRGRRGVARDGAAAVTGGRSPRHRGRGFAVGGCRHTGRGTGHGGRRDTDVDRRRHRRAPDAVGRGDREGERPCRGGSAGENPRARRQAEAGRQGAAGDPVGGGGVAAGVERVAVGRPGGGGRGRRVRGEHRRGLRGVEEVAHWGGGAIVGGERRQTPGGLDGRQHRVVVVGGGRPDTCGHALGDDQQRHPVALGPVVLVPGDHQE